MLAFRSIWLQNPTVVVNFLQSAWSITQELAPWLLLGTVITVVLYAALPKNFLAQALQGRAGVWRAVVLGVPLPLCSCGVIPAGIGLKKQGASDGAAIGFLISTPQTGVDSILVSASMLGWPFALYKVFAALVTGLVGGTLAQSKATTTTPPLELGTRPSLRDALEHGLQVIRSIWHWLVFGILVSAALTTWLPDDLFASPGSAAMSFMFALLISLPLYVCATASVPIAAALVASGMPTGAALVFLMAGPATNVATIAAVREGFGQRPFLVYLGTVVLGSAGFGVLYEVFLGDLGVSRATASMEHTQPWWATTSAVALLGLIAVFAASSLRTRIAKLTRKPSKSSLEPALVLPVEGMSCQGCVGKVQRSLSVLEGVERVDVQLEQKQARLWGKPQRDQAEAAIRDAGFKTEPTS